MVQQTEDKQLEFDPTDIEQIEWLVQNEDKFPMPLTGVNEDSETTITEITDEFVCVMTFQENGWIRRNYYYTDGTCEEFYDRQ